MADLAEQELLIKLEAELEEENKRLEECLERYISHDTSVHLELKRFVVHNFI